MRIIGQIPHPVMKITVFQLNMKYAIKFEMGLMEQIYKVRESDTINSLKGVTELIDDEFMAVCMESFSRMGEDLGQAYKRLKIA